MKNWQQMLLLITVLFQLHCECSNEKQIKRLFPSLLWWTDLQFNGAVLVSQSNNFFREKPHDKQCQRAFGIIPRCSGFGLSHSSVGYRSCGNVANSLHTAEEKAGYWWSTKTQRTKWSCLALFFPIKSFMIALREMTKTNGETTWCFSGVACPEQQLMGWIEQNYWKCTWLVANQWKHFLAQGLDMTSLAHCTGQKPLCSFLMLNPSLKTLLQGKTVI